MAGWSEHKGGYGCSLSVGIGIPIPILNEEGVTYTAVSDEEIFTQVVDYGHDYPNAVSKSYGQVSYAELKRVSRVTLRPSGRLRWRHISDGAR